MREAEITVETYRRLAAADNPAAPVAKFILVAEGRFPDDEQPVTTPTAD